jgi:hypothetical protein
MSNNSSDRIANKKLLTILLDEFGGINPNFTNSINGTNGKDGINGRDGINCTNGINGINGPDGINCTNGINGINGLPGRDGETVQLDQAEDLI